MKEVPEVNDEGKYSIISLVARLEYSIPPTHCVGDNWYSQAKSGVWELRTQESYQPICVNVIPLELRTARRCDEVMRTFQRIHQMPRSLFQPACAWPPGDRDRDTCIINCRNALLHIARDAVDLVPHTQPDAKTGKLPRPDPNEICFGSQIMAAYDPKARCDAFDGVVDYAFKGHEDSLELLCWWFGYTLWPDLSHRLALVNYGNTGTSKSTVWNYGIRGAVGTAATTSLSLSDICAPSGYSLPSLQYSLLNIGPELDANELAESSRFKLLVGGEPVPVREIYGKPYEMENYICKLVFLSNHLPRFRSGTDAELSRLRFLHWQNQVPEDKRDKSLQDRVAAERDGIFTKWMVPALQRLLGGWECPADNSPLRALFAVQNDPIQAFVMECCVLEREATEDKNLLFGAFKVWSRENNLSDGIRVLDVFGRKLLTGFAGVIGVAQPRTEEWRESGERKRKWVYSGVKLKPEWVKEASEASHEIA